MIKTMGRFVAVEPFPTQHITGSIKAGMFLMDQKIQLTKLKVVYGTAISAGEGVAPVIFSDYQDPENQSYRTLVCVMADQYAQPWAKKIYELEEGKPFILVPVESIVLVEYPGV